MTQEAQNIEAGTAIHVKSGRVVKVAAVSFTESAKGHRVHIQLADGKAFKVGIHAPIKVAS